MSLMYIPSLLVVFMGSLDCLTTVIGTLFFDTQELNPLISNLVSTNLPAFVLVKLSVSFAVGGIFVLAERTLKRSNNQEDKSFKVAHNTLRAAYIGITLFLLTVVINNVLVVLRAL